MKNLKTKISTLLCFLLLTATTVVNAQQTPADPESIMDQMEKMLQEFGQGSFFQMDTLLMQDFEFPSDMDSFGYGFNYGGQGEFPGFFFSDTLLTNPNGPGASFDMDLQGLIQELSRSLEEMDPSYLEDMEELMKQFRSNGIVPDEEYLIPEKQPKKKKRVYKI